MSYLRGEDGPSDCFSCASSKAEAFDLRAAQVGSSLQETPQEEELSVGPSEFACLLCLFLEVFGV